jgi:hypothetical protein
MKYIIIILILFLIIYFLNKKDKKEKYIYVQNHKNHQYINPFFWNAPTRFNRNSAPYLLLTPERNILF